MYQLEFLFRSLWEIVEGQFIYFQKNLLEKTFSVLFNLAKKFLRITDYQSFCTQEPEDILGHFCVSKMPVYNL